MEKLLPLVLLSICCYSCGEDKDDPVTTPTPATQVKILEGVLVDAAVEGVSYTSGATTGLTDKNGTFKYEEGKKSTGIELLVLQHLIYQN